MKSKPALPEAIWESIILKAGSGSLLTLKKVSRNMRGLVLTVMQQRWDTWCSEADRPCPLNKVSEELGEELDSLLFKEICHGQDTVIFPSMSSAKREWLHARAAVISPKIISSDVSSSGTAGSKKDRVRWFIPREFDFAAILSCAPRSGALEHYRSEKRKEKWRAYCKDCGRKVKAEDAFLDGESDGVQCRACVDYMEYKCCNVFKVSDGWDWFDPEGQQS